MEPMILRISPSGQIAGDESNPPLIGGTATPSDGSVQLGRVWLYNGTGTSGVDVPGTATAGSVDGMDSLVVDLQSGYSYDVQADVDVYGTLMTSDEYVISVEGSDNGGSTWTYTDMLVSQNAAFSRRFVGDFTQNDMRGRAHTILDSLVTAGSPPVNRVRLQLKRIIDDADGFMKVYPATTTLQIQEFKRV